MEKREILFRGWNKKNKKWIYGYYFTYRGNHFISPDDKVNPLDTYKDYVVDADTVGQYTGLKDANAVKIFEGDIIIEVDSFRHVIQYKKNAAKFVAILEGISDVYCGIDQQWMDKYKMVIIGNVHETPELIKRE